MLVQLLDSIDIVARKFSARTFARTSGVNLRYMCERAAQLRRNNQRPTSDARTKADGGIWGSILGMYRDVFAQDIFAGIFSRNTGPYAVGVLYLQNLRLLRGTLA